MVCINIEHLFHYYEMDVNILRKACVKFSQLIENVVNGIFPFYDKNCMTIACTNFLQPKVVIIPILRYRNKINQSLIALVWLPEFGKNK